MRENRSLRPRYVRLVWVALAMALCLLTAAAATVPAADAASPAPSGSPTAAASTLTCELSATAVTFGAAVTASGVLTPAAEGQDVVIMLRGAEVATAVTDASGAYTATFTPECGGEVVALLAADAAVAAAPQTLAVKPVVRFRHGALVPFVPSRIVVTVAPASYDGVVALKIIHRRRVVGTYKARAKAGKAVFRVRLRGVDTFRLIATLPSAAGLARRTAESRVSVRAKTLSAGARGPYVKGMLIGLRRLRFRIPGLGSTFTSSVKDSVMAFQKAYRLPRTYVFNTACWRKLDGAKIIKPRYKSPSTHIEVDKGRQILMVVKRGAPAGIICVSTGATGNTPEGRFRIQQKHPFTSSGYGGVLVRTMGFIGNFAIHGYSPVPPYPASHGCVREPIWACYWVYNNSWVGETLYIYH